MPSQNWGDLTKSAVDDELVEEAIGRLIAVHEAAADSHLGVGESLQSHKSEEIIDHPVASVIGDKYGGKDFTLHPIFESLDNYSVGGVGAILFIGGGRFESYDIPDDRVYIQAYGQYSPQYYKITKDCTFQITATAGGGTGEEINLVAGGVVGAETAPGVGFKLTGGKVYALETCWFDASPPDDFVEYTEEITGISPTSKHIYRVQVVASEGKAYFYIDGVLKTNLTLHTSDDTGIMLFTIELLHSASDTGSVTFGEVYLSIEI